MDASELYKKAVDLKAKGQMDLALTEFRRAVLADNTLAAAHYEIGMLCREKVKREPLFQRHCFEAFRNAARLDLTHADAHTQYIMAAQKMGLLEDLHQEYLKLAKDNPDNAMLQQCLKNVVTISMAMMPQRVTVADSKSIPGLGKALAFVSIGLMLVGVVMIGSAFVMKRKGRIDPPAAASLLRWGGFAAVLGMGGLLLRSRVK